MCKKLVLGAILLSFLGLYWGAVDISFQSLWKDEIGFDDSAKYVLWQIRIPRVLFTFLVGAVLAFCGTLSQGIFRNYLAEPGLLGISSGSAAGAALALVFLPGGYFLSGYVQSWLLPISSFLGGLGTCYVIEIIARRYLNFHSSSLLLLGIAINAIVASWIGICTYLASDEQLRNLSFWTLGSLGAASWTSLVILFILMSVFLYKTPHYLGALNAMALGNDVAKQIGIDVKRIRTHLIITIALLQSLVIAWCGMISFIGLLAPNIARLCVGDDVKKTIPLAMLMGGVILLAADIFARNLAAPAEIPIGILTSLLGGPFFLFLLLRHKV